jgi:hypothetical protein
LGLNKKEATMLQNIIDFILEWSELIAGVFAEYPLAAA